MSNGGFTGRSFQTAAHRRRGAPVKFEIVTWVYDGDEDEVGREEAIVFRVDPMLDLIRLGSAMGGLAGALKNLKASKPGEVEQLEDRLDALDRMEKELPRVRDSIRDALIPTQRKDWDRVASTVDVQTLGEVVRLITNELSGKDPSQAASSSAGSAPTSTTSTDGAQPTE